MSSVLEKCVPFVPGSPGNVQRSTAGVVVIILAPDRGDEGQLRRYRGVVLAGIRRQLLGCRIASGVPLHVTILGTRRELWAKIELRSPLAATRSLPTVTVDESAVFEMVESQVPAKDAQSSICESTNDAVWALGMDEMNEHVQLLISARAVIPDGGEQIGLSRGVLLEGRAGAGKTFLMTRMVSYWQQNKLLGMDAAVIHASELSVQSIEKTMARIKQGINNLFHATDLQVRVLWIDDLDLLLHGDGGEDDHEEENSIFPGPSGFCPQLNELLHSTAAHREIILIASITSPRSKSISRPLSKLNLFGERVVLQPPDALGRRRILSGMTNSLQLPEESKSWLVNRTAGYCARDLERVIRRAQRIMYRHEHNRVQLSKSGQHIDSALSPTCIGQALLDSAGPSELATANQQSDRWQRSQTPQVCGYHSVKAELVAIVEQGYKYRSLWHAIGQSMPKGVLLHGPSGCGKSLLAHSLASVFPWANYVELSTTMFGGAVGSSEQAIRDLLARARATSPTIVIIDELDNIASKRSNEDNENVSRRLLGTLLNEMDGVGHKQDYQSKKGRESDSQPWLMFVGCTNRLDMLDAAIIRPGRFDRSIHVGLPDLHDRCELISYAMRGVGSSCGSRMSTNITDAMLRALANSTEGASCADVISRCRDLKLKSMQ